MSIKDQVKMFQVYCFFPLKMDSELLDLYLFLRCFGTLSNIKCTFCFLEKNTLINFESLFFIAVKIAHSLALQNSEVMFCIF